jgi:hypothetical protein
MSFLVGKSRLVSASREARELCCRLEGAAVFEIIDRLLSK